MKNDKLLICCLLLGLVLTDTICAQESALLHKDTIPATEQYGSINYAILLPPSYENSAGPYPVIYYLHGLNRHYAGPRAQWIAAFFNKQFIEKQLPEFIMVFLDGGEGFWCDHADVAVSIYARHPELFAATISLDGPLITWEDFLYFQGDQPDVFGTAEYYYEYGSPNKWMKQNRKALLAKPDTSIFLTAGFLIDANKKILS